MTASHCKRGSNLKRRAALDPGGKRSGNSPAASIVIVGERLGHAGCLLFGSDRARLTGGRRDAVQLLICREESRGIFPTDWLHFTAVCCKAQYRTFVPPSANVCLQRASESTSDVLMEAQLGTLKTVSHSSCQSRAVTDSSNSSPSECQGTRYPAATCY